MELEDALLLVAALVLAALAFFVVVVPMVDERRCLLLDAMLAALPFAHFDVAHFELLQGFKDCDAFVHDLAFRVRGDIFQRFCENENKMATAFAAAPLVGHAPLCFGMGFSRDAARPFVGLAYAVRETDFHEHEFEVPGPGVLVRVQASAAAPKYICNERANEASLSQVAVFESSTGVLLELRTIRTVKSSSAWLESSLRRRVKSPRSKLVWLDWSLICRVFCPSPQLHGVCVFSCHCVQKRLQQHLRKST